MLAHVRPEYREIAIELIDDPELASRINPDDESIESLVQRIRTLGFFSTINVKPRGDRFEVIAGHRRTIAARRAGLSTLPCLVYPSDACLLEAIQQAENVERKELSPAEEAIWFAELYERHPEEGTDGLAARVNEKRAYVEARLALLQGDDQVFAALRDGKIGVGVAQQLNRCTNQMYRRHLLDQAIRNGCTVATAATWIAEWVATIEPATRGALKADAPAPAAAPIVNDYFTCHACGSKAHPERMRPINVHDYCVDANVAPALEMWRRKSDYIARPRTLAEAIDLVNTIVDAWPDIAREAPPAA